MPSLTGSLLGVSRQGRRGPHLQFRQISLFLCGELRILGVGAGLGTVGNRVLGKELTQAGSRFSSPKTCLVFCGYQPSSLLESS